METMRININQKYNDYKKFCENFENELGNDIINDIKQMLRYKEELSLKNSVTVRCWNRGFDFEVHYLSIREDDSVLINGNYNGISNVYDFLSYVDFEDLVNIYNELF